MSQLAGTPGADAEPPEKGRLDSWGEIRQAPGRSVRTVQRWEAEERLPIHRHHHLDGNSVYAFNQPTRRVASQPQSSA